jgi:hypothetical protein
VKGGEPNNGMREKTYFKLPLLMEKLVTSSAMNTLAAVAGERRGKSDSESRGEGNDLITRSHL